MGMRGRSRGGGNREESVVGAWRGQEEEQGMSGGRGGMRGGRGGMRGEKEEGTACGRDRGS